MLWLFTLPDMSPCKSVWRRRHRLGVACVCKRIEQHLEGLGLSRHKSLARAHQSIPVCLQNANNVLLISSSQKEKGFESKVSILWLGGCREPDVG